MLSFNKVLFYSSAFDRSHCHLKRANDRLYKKGNSFFILQPAKTPNKERYCKLNLKKIIALLYIKYEIHLFVQK